MQITITGREYKELIQIKRNYTHIRFKLDMTLQVFKEQFKGSDITDAYQIGLMNRIIKLLENLNSEVSEEEMGIEE